MSEHDENNNKPNPEETASAFVSLVQDPFGLKTLEITEAQGTEDEELPTDDFEMIDEVEAQADLDRLSEALADPMTAVSEWKPDADASALASAEEAEQSAALLAAQIAEDEALQAELAQETADEAGDDATLSEQMDISEIQSSIEAILFMSEKPLSLEKIQEMLGPDFKHSVFQEAITALVDRYSANEHGIEIVAIANGYQFRTKPGRAELAKKLSRIQTQRLSSGAMETLAIVAYRQPAMKEDVDKIRGVDSSYFVRQLLDRKLIEISGRSDLPGRPMVYSTTDTFLALFGLKDLSAMPSLREIEQMVPASQSGSADDEDPRVKEMRRLVSHMKADTTRLEYDPEEDDKILSEIRERVKSIPTSTPSLDAQKEAEKAAQKAAQEAAEAGSEPQIVVETLVETVVQIQPELPSN
ncbi:MAG: SMC-Scp complex subunit ScpB [Oligoflexia bacterium]|nr:SMC-Scp complex subunit ScpB [Oligoflexia bacterium]